MPFDLWVDGTCGHCGTKCGDVNDEDNQPYRLQCPECYRDGCEECMPSGRGCVCLECEYDSGHEDYEDNEEEEE